MKALLETVERLEAWLSETKISGTIPPAFVEKCTAILNAAPSPGGLWDAWKIAAKDMARAIQMDGGTSDALRTVFFDGIDEVRNALLTNSPLVESVVSSVIDRFELFRPELAMAEVPEQQGIEIDEEIREAFISEASELLQQIEECVISLQQNPQSVERLFRVMHTLKGSSGMVGMQAMNRLAHSAEEILEKIRGGEIAPTVLLEEALLKSKDIMSDCVVRMENRQNTEIEVDSMIEELRRSTAGESVTVKLEVAPAAVRETVVEKSPPLASAPVQPAPESSQGAKGTARKESASIRINQEKLDEVFDRMGQVVIGKIRIESRLNHMGLMISSKSDPSLWKARVVESYEALCAALEEYTRSHSALQERVMALRLAPVGTVFDRFPRVVRETARKVGKEIDFIVHGADVEIDKSICEAIVDPLIHLLRNAIDHGIESPDARVDQGKDAAGRLNLSASYRGDRVVIEIADDGKGMDPGKLGALALQKGVITAEELNRLEEREKLMLIFRPGFSTAEKVSDLSGRGVGMDVVRDVIERLKGSVEVESVVGQGSRISLFLPLTLALIDLLIVSVGRDIVAFPLYVIRETLRLSESDVERAGDRPVISVRGSYLPVISLGEVLGIDSREEGHLHCVVVEVMGEAVALNVDGFLERSQAVLKPLGALMARAPFVSGATILGDGRIVPVLDPVPIVREASRRSVKHASKGKEAEIESSARRVRILVVEDSQTMSRQLVTILKKAGYSAVVAEDGVEALQILQKQSFDLISTDIMMPRMDGYELSRKLRAEARFETLPIIALSSKSDKLDRIKGFESGFDEYLAKPVDETMYLAVIDRLLRRPVEGRTSERRGAAVT